jgi:REP element-mobilizing transposase RayT
MSEKYKFNDEHGMYFVTLTTVGWVDLFTRLELKHVIIDSLRYCQKEKGLVIHAWCLMPSHLHMIVSTNQEPLQDIMRDFKKFTSKKIVETIQQIPESRKEFLLDKFDFEARRTLRAEYYKFWKDDNHTILMDGNIDVMQKINYIHENPVRDGIVNEPEHYIYSSAIDYTGGKGLVKVIVL